MSVIQLNLIELCKLGEHVIMLLFISSNYVIERCGAEEVLLLQSKLFTCICFVIGVENTCDVLSVLSIADGTIVITAVKLVEIEMVHAFRFPKS